MYEYDDSDGNDSSIKVRYTEFHCCSSTTPILDTVVSIRFRQYQFSSRSNHKIITETKSFIFKKPMEVIVDIDEYGSYYLDWDEAHLYTCGDSEKGLMDDLDDDLDFSWEQYALEKDESKMDKSAIDFKNWLLQNIEKRQ